MNMDDPSRSVALIAGPTASGKSALALELAQRMGGVVINADSAQVYADLRVLSARPSDAELAQAPHALYGHVDGADDYSAPRWAGEARGAIADAHAAGRLPILVGGTGLYLRTLIDGIAPVPEIDPDIRAEVRALPTAEAHAELSRLDPVAAERLNAADTTRVARALEVVRSTGRTLAGWQEQRTGGIGGQIDLLPLILLPDREWLFGRCDQRVETMLETGAIEEVQALIARTLPHPPVTLNSFQGPGAVTSPRSGAFGSGERAWLLKRVQQDEEKSVPLAAPVRRAIGVTEIAAWLSGQTTREQAVSAMQLATRQYAKRQYTWFRNQPPPEWPRLADSQNTDMDRKLATLLRR
jgi:tRNA dimethylallyltransferase